MNKTSFSIVIWAFLVFSTFICGMWIGFSGEEIKLGDKIFHMGLASLTFFSTLIIFNFFLKSKSKGVLNY